MSFDLVFFFLSTKIPFLILNKILIQISLIHLRENNAIRSFSKLSRRFLYFYEYSQLSNYDRFLCYNTLSKINRNQIENQGKRHYQVMRIKSGPPCLICRNLRSRDCFMHDSTFALKLQSAYFGTTIWLDVSTQRIVMRGTSRMQSVEVQKRTFTTIKFQDAARSARKGRKKDRARERSSFRLDTRSSQKLTSSLATSRTPSCRVLNYK